MITNIELEHTEVLGGTRAAIAREKGGILKPGATLVTSLAPDDEAGRVVRAIAAERGCKIVWVEVDGHETIERENVALAGAALDALGGRGVCGALGEIVGAQLLDAGTRATARLVGRMERIDVPVGDAIVPVVLDGAHVPFNIAHVLRDLSQAPDLAGPAVAVVALAADKDAAGFIRELGERASPWSSPVCHRPRAAGRRRNCMRSLWR